ncbi:hypothetical protein HD554DRAFT_1990371, partial [Boletus coccyginus]
RVKVILEQFFYDMVQESPNKKAATEGAWINIPKELRAQEATERLYQSFALPFVAAQWTICTPEQWELHFSRMFPAQRPASVGQNFRKCTYYTQWLTLVEDLGPQALSRVRAAIRAKFDTLVWIPFTGSDRMWCTRPMTGRGWFMLPKPKPGQAPAGPQIGLNP